jgi:hypothetical protein
LRVSLAALTGGEASRARPTEPFSLRAFRFDLEFSNGEAAALFERSRKSSYASRFNLGWKISAEVCGVNGNRARRLWRFVEGCAKQKEIGSG